MDKTLHNRTVALAALYQAAELTRQVAWKGVHDVQLAETALKSLITEDVTAIEEIYGGIASLRIGLDILRDHNPEANYKRNIELARYTLSLLHLERKLINQPEKVDIIRKGIENAQQQRKFFGEVLHPNVIAALADTYQNSVSQISPRIIVQGEQRHLANTDNASKIRTFLLAGMRAAVLWEQAGGSRLRLLFERKKYSKTAERLFRELYQSQGTAE